MTLTILSIFMAGMLEGLAETLKFHYYRFVKVCPGAADSYWNPDISWTNKYKDGDYTKGPKFFGSTTFLVWTTDGYHLSRFLRNIFLILAIVLHTQVEGSLIINYIVHLLSFQIGFTVVYDLIFKK